MMRTSFLAACISLMVSGPAPADTQAQSSREIMESLASHLAPHWAPQLEEACGANDAASCVSLGILYHMSLGDLRDQAKARVLFGKACDLQDKKGCEAIGLLAPSIQASIVAARDTEEAFGGFHLLSSACSNGVDRGCESFEFAVHSLQDACRDESEGSFVTCNILSALGAE